MTAPLVYFGTVESTKDPDGLGRVQVKLHGFPGDATLPWIRLVQPQAGDKSGWIFLPEKGTEVVVLRGNADHVESMVVLGSVYNGKVKPLVADSDGKNKTKQIVTPAGTQIVISDEAGKESIEISSGKGKVKLRLDAGQQTITIESSKTVKIAAKGPLEIECAQATVNVKGTAKIEASVAEVSGKTVKVASTGPLQLDGKVVQISGPSIDIG